MMLNMAGGDVAFMVADAYANVDIRATEIKCLCPYPMAHSHGGQT